MILVTKLPLGNQLPRNSASLVGKQSFQNLRSQAELGNEKKTLEQHREKDPWDFQNPRDPALLRVVQSPKNGPVMSFTTEQIQEALKHLKRSDPVMKKLIRDVGPFTLQPNRNHFRMLMRSIISQQISTKAARSIRLKVESLVKPKTPTAKNFADFSDETLRSAGLSPQKTRYLRDLCEHVLAGRLRLRRLGNLSDEEVIAELIQVKGIGLWTAQMFLMFSLGRLDILPHDDLGIRSAMQQLYELDELPNKQACHQIAQPWRPYATVACWYCWRSVDLEESD